MKIIGGRIKCERKPAWSVAVRGHQRGKSLNFHAYVNNRMEEKWVKSKVVSNDKRCLLWEYYCITITLKNIF